jgi:alpha-galactosidase
MKLFLLFAVATAIAQSGLAQLNRTNAPSGSGQIELNGCYARWGGGELRAGNSRFERRWVVQRDRLRAVSFRSRNPDFEWLAPSDNTRADTNAPTTVAAATGRFGPVEAESLRLDVIFSGSANRHEAVQVFPDAPGAILFDELDSSAAGSGSGANDGDQPTGVENTRGRHSRRQVIATEDLTLAAHHVRLTRVDLMDQTDVHNEMASEREWLLVPSESTINLSSVLIFLEDPLTKSGLVMVKMAPLPHARPVPTPADFIVNPGAKRVQAVATDYPIVTLAYHGGRVGRIAALQKFQRQLRTLDPSRDGIFLSNTWGDRSKDARINEEFMLKEIAAAAELGVDVVEIDDGWMKGHTANSVRGGHTWGNWWAANPEFWDVDPTRFPNGLEPVVKAARDKGMRLGLWFSPDASNGAANWMKDADVILKLYRDLGVQYIKIDGLDTRTVETTKNERRLFDSVLEKSHGAVVFDLDVTAGRRPAYFGMPEIGPIFLENRYTDWHRYWPHLTLRNLWELSHYVDPIRLRMELLNNTRNTDQYKDDPLAPALYRADTLFAMTMVASPLGWFEVSNLPKEYIAQAAPLVATWKRERARLHGGTTVPIGSAPDGAAWTGFVSIASDNVGGYALLFRELNENPEYTIDLKQFFRGNLKPVTLAGRGQADVNDGRLTVRIPASLDYLWVRLDRAKQP